MSLPPAGESIAEHIGRFAVALRDNPPPPGIADIVRAQIMDVVGLCVAARNEDYLRAVLNACEAGGPCTAIGHAQGYGTLDAALINGVAAHGEDFDDTFEGTPVHAGAVVVPAVLALCEQSTHSGQHVLAGVSAGVELMCRMALVAPTAIHRAGFHPTAVIGAMGATAAAGTCMGLNATTLASALGIAGSLASGIIEYLAEGTSTKRLHAGWAAQSGIRAARACASRFQRASNSVRGQPRFFSSVHQWRRGGGLHTAARRPG